jgi:septal ring factor EnvC (AmiA/AmiB activator)
LGTVIVGILSFAGTYISNHKSNAVWQYRVQQLEEKQDKHNNLVERTYKLEKDMASQERDMKTAFNQISDIKSSVSKVKEGVSKLSSDM